MSEKREGEGGPAEEEEAAAETTPGKETAEESAPATKPKRRRIPHVFRNFISLAGLAVVVASFLAIVFLILLELAGATDNPYLGIFTYMIFPAILIFGILIALVGAIFERRRRRKLSPSEIDAYPKLDLNQPQQRRAAFIFLGLTFLFIFLSAYGSYRAHEYTNSIEFCGKLCHSVMKPEFVAYQASPHARVTCVECHVGEGAGWYVRSKLSGLRQVYAVTFNTYSKPIPTPVHNLRPAQDTCEHCHWPAKFFGAQLKIFNRYAYDEKNSLSQTRMLINTGGGSPETGQVQGIHWHMNIANEVTYIARDEQRQDIRWVRIKDRQGNVTEYFKRGETMTPAEIEAAENKRVMDCVDCHNRPSHIYLPPDTAVNDALVAGKLDVSLPYIKRQSVEVLMKPYATTEEALSSISTGLDSFYRTNYADVYAAKGGAIKQAIAEIQRIYQTFFFPEMRTDWRSHPNNIGHYYYQGCFRCHDGQHVSPAGKVIRTECNICHTVLDQTNGGRMTVAQDGAFKHPVELGDLSNRNCTSCHSGGKAFQHPVNLGDISQFTCVDCHAGKVWPKGNL